MKIGYHKKFKKKYKKLFRKDQDRFNETLIVFEDNPFEKSLQNHILHGKYKDCRSINITGDLRAIYKNKSDSIIFIDIDTHSNLYS